MLPYGTRVGIFRARGSDPEVCRLAAGMSDRLGLRPRTGARIVAPGASPGTCAVNYNKPQTGRRNNRSMRPRPIGNFRPSHPPTVDTSTPPWLLLLPRPPHPKTGGVPYGKKVRATGIPSYEFPWVHECIWAPAGAAKHVSIIESTPRQGTARAVRSSAPPRRRVDFPFGVRALK